MEYSHCGAEEEEDVQRMSDGMILIYLLRPL